VICCRSLPDTRTCSVGNLSSQWGSDLDRSHENTGKCWECLNNWLINELLFSWSESRKVSIANIRIWNWCLTPSAIIRFVSWCPFQEFTWMFSKSFHYYNSVERRTRTCGAGCLFTMMWTELEFEFAFSLFHLFWTPCLFLYFYCFCNFHFTHVKVLLC
jgi:hypothetical protein